MMPRLFRYIYRDADNGRFVTKEDAERWPAITIRQRIWFWQKAPKS